MVAMAPRDTDPILRVTGLGKTYRLYEKPADRLKELLLRRKYHLDFMALRDVSFSLGSGRTLGVIGDNGAGKSTLLQLIAGTLTPSSGTIECHGSVLGLLELGLGFHPDFSGRQNVFLYGDMLGLSRRLVQSRLDEIVAFAELEAFIDRPLKTYSTGMRMRLAFSLVSSLDPDILIVDEALAVGDIHFQKKCIDRMMEVKGGGRTIIFCSHSTYQIGMFCDEVLWLKDGTVSMLGEIELVLPAYEAYQAKKDVGQGQMEDPQRSSPVRIAEFEVLNALPIRRGEDLSFRLLIESLSGDLSYHLTLSLKMDTGRGIHVTGTHLSGKPPLRGKRCEVKIIFPRIPLMGGIYSAHARVFDDQGLMIYHEQILPELVVRKDSKELGIFYLENRWEMN